MTENRIRLGCNGCDRDDFDGVAEIPTDWIDINEVQTFEAAREEVSWHDKTTSPFDWQTHLGTCPECQKEEDRDGS